MNGSVRWREIAGDLRAQIEDGRLAPDGRVPSEDSLAAQYHVARMTARTALLYLEQTGLVTPGRPRRVSAREPLLVNLTREAGDTWAGESPTAGADSWLGDAAAAGRNPSQEIMVIIAVASAESARRLQILPGEPVVARQLLREAGGKRHNMITFWFPADVANGTPLAEPADIAEGSLAWLERTRGPMSHEVEVSSRMPAQEEAQTLGIPSGVPVMIVWRTSKADSLPVVTSVAVYPADRAILRLGL